MEHYYQSEIECASREQIRAWQNERLIPTVKRVYENVPYYRHLMEEKGVTPDDIRSVDDLHKLPFLTKEDLRQAYPYGLLAVPLEDCVRIQSTSGTTGRRVVAFYTQHDIDQMCIRDSSWPAQRYPRENRQTAGGHGPCHIGRAHPRQTIGMEIKRRKEDSSSRLFLTRYGSARRLLQPLLPHGSKYTSCHRSHVFPKDRCAPDSPGS